MIAYEIVERFKAMNQVSIDGWERISKSLREQSFEKDMGITILSTCLFNIRGID
jgi:hypothetical protein